MKTSITAYTQTRNTERICHPYILLLRYHLTPYQHESRFGGDAERVYFAAAAISADFA